MATRKITRRDFLNLSVMGAAGVVAAACSRDAPEVVELVKERAPKAEAPADASAMKEAPQLAQRVKEGTLPPLAERLPENPKVKDIIGGTEGVHKGEIGQYGGTLFLVAFGVGRMFECMHAREVYMLHVNNDVTEAFPEVAEAYEFSEDFTELTFHLRKGMKWSDGAPYSADDIIFWWEEEQLNEDIRPEGPFGYWKIAGEWTEFIKVDDFTVMLRFPQPYPPSPVLGLQLSYALQPLLGAGSLSQKVAYQI